MTLLGGDHRVGRMTTSVSKIQIGQLWKKDGTDETYLVTRVYSEALTRLFGLAAAQPTGAESPEEKPDAETESPQRRRSDAENRRVEPFVRPQRR